MPPVKFTEVLSFSSEDPNHPSNNLLRPDTFRKWKCAAGSSDKQAFVILKLEKLTSIHSVDIGNEGSAFVEVLVAREGGDFQVLLVASSFMTPTESRSGIHLSRLRMFGSDKLNKNVAEQKWDRLKVICTQPFNKNMQYGLSFIAVTTSSEESSSSTPKTIKLGSFTLKDEDDSDSISVGSVFARRKDSEGSSRLTGAAAIRAASAAAATSPCVESKVKPHNAPDVGFYQLKKNVAPERESSKTSETSKHAASPSDSTPSRKHSHKDKEKQERRKNHEDKHEGSHKKRKIQDEKEEKKSDKHKRDREQEKRRRESDKKKDSEVSHRKNKENDDQNRASSSSVSSKKKSAPFTALMKDVNFVLSGYQNPQRSQIRDLMIDMGAKYKPDWDRSCTHLICAFSNTPKYQQVKGKGRIINAKWTFDCHKNKIRYPTKRYALDKQKNDDDSEEEIWAEELLPKEEKRESKNLKSITDHTSDVEGSDPGKYSDDTYSDNEDTDDEIQRVLAKKTIKEEETAKKDKTSLEATSENAKKTPIKKIKLEERNEKPIQKIKLEERVEKPIQKIKLEERDEKPFKKVKLEERDEKPNVSRQSSSRNFAVGEDVIRDMNGTDDNIYDEDTDVDEENKVHLTRPDTAALPLPSLGDYFHGKYFLLYGNMSAETKQFLSRYIVAFDGVLENYMSSKVNFVITNDDWDDNFDEALADNPAVQFVKPTWIWRCCDRKKLVPFQPFMVVPKE